MSDTNSIDTDRDEELYEDLSTLVDEREGETGDPQACLATVEDLADNLRKAGWANERYVDMDSDQ